MTDYRKKMGPEKLDAIMLYWRSITTFGNVCDINIHISYSFSIKWCAAKGPRLVQIIMNEERAKLKQERDAVQVAFDAVDGQEGNASDDMEEEEN